ncbi:MAG: hypothetical protein LAP85_09635 [Acidobacteriia bacterium]|nr:hypothetical protein [Terriglobia bacterium]
MKIRLFCDVGETLIIDHARGCLRYRGSSRVVDGATLHADPKARIFTDSPERVCLALGIPFPDPQVIEEQ